MKLQEIIKEKIEEINALKDLLADTFESSVVKYDHPRYLARLRRIEDELLEARAALNAYYEVK